MNGRWAAERSRHGGVDRIPVEGVPGSLYLCGKHFIGPDVDKAMAAVGATRVVCLNEERDLAGRFDEYVGWLRASHGEAARWVPVPDFLVPAFEEAVETIDGIVADLEAGHTVLMHCGAGIGRAGTMAAAVLVRRGATAREAIDVVAAHRPMAGPEAGVQREFLDDLEAFCS